MLNRLTNELQTLFFELFDKYNKNSVYNNQQFFIWKTGDITIEPLYLNLYNWKTEIDLGIHSFKDFYNEYNELFDKSFEDFLGWKKPENEKDLIKFIDELFTKEFILNTHFYYILIKNNKIIGVLYLYKYSEIYKKANLSLGLKHKYRGKGLGYQVTQSTINYFMNRKNPFLTRLGIEVETINTQSILLVENKLLKIGFKKEGLLRNNYGKGINCYVYSYIC